jgi:hypothetical protein
VQLTASEVESEVKIDPDVIRVFMDLPEDKREALIKKLNEMEKEATDEEG